MINFNIKIPTCKAIVKVYVGNCSELPNSLKPVFDGEQLAKCIYRKTNNNLCFEVVIHSKSAAISVIAHEAVHAASFIFDAMGCYADFNNDEHVSYFVQHICEVAENKLGVYDNYVE